MTPILRSLAAGQELSTEEAERAMRLLLTGQSSPEQTAGLLMGLRSRGESIDELAAFTRVMRDYAVPVRVDDPNVIDIVGTGGDGGGTFNISTATMFVCAGAGATVAKHGNRSVSSKCGSADVLEALGVRVDLQADGVAACIADAGLGFMFAPLYHPALRFVMPVRRALAARTFFNILGPLCNPASVRRGLFGAFSLGMAETMSEIMMHLDGEHVIAVHSEDGLDECSIAAPTRMFHRVGDTPPEVRTIAPEDVGLERSPLSSIRGGTAPENAEIIHGILGGVKGPHRDVVVLNGAFALVAAGLADTSKNGARMAEGAIDSGKAAAKLAALIDASNEHAH